MKQVSTLYPPEEGYTFREVQIYLARFRSRQIPRSTLQRWINVIGLSPDEFGLYDPSDLPYLVRLSLWLERGGTFQGFVNLLLQEISNAKRTTSDEHCTIEV